MPTLGELLTQIRDGGMNPEPSGDSPYGGVQPGSNSPISQPGIDDLKEETKTALGDYLSQRTGGQGNLAETNKYNLGPGLAPVSLTSPEGQPAPLTTAGSADQPSFIPFNPSEPEEISLSEGFEILKRLGFFLDLQGSDGPDYDKNGQTSGHELLNRPDVREKVSTILATSRFSAMTNPDTPFATPVDVPEYDFIDEEGVRKDHPQIEKIKAIAAYVTATGKRAKEAYPNSKLLLARDPDATGASAFGESANLEYGEIDPNNGIDPTSGMPESGTPNDNSPSDGNNTAIDFTSSVGVINTPDFPYGVDTNAQGAQLIALGIDVVVEALDPAIELLNGLFGLFGLQGVYVNQPHIPSSLSAGMRFGFGGTPSPTQIDFATGEVAELPTFPAANAGYRFIQSINIPIPRFLVKASGDPNDLVKKMVTLGTQYIKNLLQQDPTTVNYWKGFLRKARRQFSAENNFGLPEIPSVPNMATLTSNQKFLEELRDSPALQFIRSMAIIAETTAASSVTGGSSLQPQGYRFGTQDLNELVNSAVNRHASYAKKGYGKKAGFRNLPSLFLLPSQFARGMAYYRHGDPNHPTNVSRGLSGNKSTNDIYLDLLQVTNGPPTDGAGQAVIDKEGVSMASPDRNRFSREEVEAIENMLEAEHLPFYFHDLRTNEIVSFHAFLNALSDSFSPAYNASSGFGRIEDVQIYQKTTRAIQVDFTLISYSKDDMTEMYFKMNKLIAMVYPQYSRGTMLEHISNGPTPHPTRFVQPFSQVTTATPVIRLRVGDLIKSNYSREGIARLMGADDPDFVIMDDAPPAPIDVALPCQTVVQSIITAVSPKPLDPNGEYDPTKGWPVGSIVIVDPNYGHNANDPLVAYDPETDTVGSDWTADIVTGRIGVKILSYHTFNNPLGGSNPNLEEIVIKVELVPMLPIDFFPTQDRIATRTATNEPITTGFLSYNDIQIADSAQLYCHGINVDLFEDRVPTTQQVPAPEGTPGIEADTTEFENMRDRIFGDKNPIMRSFETTAGRGLAGVITSLNFDWGINGEINWDLAGVDYKAPQGCKISISFTPIHDISPGLDVNGVMRAPVFNVAGASMHGTEDVHPGDGSYERRRASLEAQETQYQERNDGSSS